MAGDSFPNPIGKVVKLNLWEDGDPIPGGTGILVRQREEKGIEAMEGERGRIREGNGD